MDITKLPFPKKEGLKHIKEYRLSERLFLGQWIVPAGTTIKLCTSRDFGYCFVPFGTKDERGFEIPKRVFRW